MNKEVTNNKGENSPLVSIVMPAYNSENFIADSINSVINQSFKNWELIIINDKSTDDTLNIIKKIAVNEKRIKVLENEKNLGVAESRNRGVLSAASDWIAFLDSDDLWTEKKLEKQMSEISNNPDIKFSFTGSAFINVDGKAYGYILHVPKIIQYKELLKQNLISCSSVLIRKEYLLGIKMLNEDLHEDFLTWLMVLKDTDAYGIDEPLLIYRIAKGSKSANKIKALVMNYRVYKRAGLNLFERIYYMCFYIIKSFKKYKSIFK